MDAVPPMLVKPADMLRLEIWSIKRKIPLRDNTPLNVVVHRILLREILVAGFGV